MNILAVICTVILLLYVLRIIKYKASWEQYPQQKFTGKYKTATISVVIAFRDEKDNLPGLLNALQLQQYPKDLFEVILVDDHSVDGSDGLAEDFCMEHGNFRLIRNKEKENGKKEALQKGIRLASGELIVTTDADCTMNDCWLAAIAQVYHELNADFIIGLVDISTGKTFPGKFQEVEFLSLIAAGAGAVASNRPIYCNGANLAFKRKLFGSMNDPLTRNVISGDDTFFLHAVKKTGKYKIVPAKSIHALVVTRGLNSLKDFSDQRKRWVSKSRYYRDKDILYTAVLVISISLTELYSLAAMITGLNFWLFPALFVCRTVTDFVFLKGFMSFIKKDLPAGLFLVYEILYPFYAVYFAVAGIFPGFHWKGRRSGINYPVPT